MKTEKVRYCRICKAPLSTYNKSKECFCHKFPKNYDPVGTKVRQLSSCTSPTNIGLFFVKIDYEGN